jgi:DNA-binding beta-propeller fold protein YncE
MRLPNQWTLDPVGKQIALGDFPVNIAIHPAGRYAAVLHSGNSQHEVVIVDVRSGKVVSRVNLDESFYGLTFSPNGKTLYASGAGREVIHSFTFENGFLSAASDYKLRATDERGVPSGIAVTPDGKRLYAANLFKHTVSEVDLETGKTVPAEFKLAPAELTATRGINDPWRDLDDESVTKRARALLDVVNRDAPYPYTCVVDAIHNRLLISLWGQASIEVIDLKTRRSLGRWATQEHPNELLLTRSGKHLFVANANRNTVSILETETGRTIETLTSELGPEGLPGSTPNSLALTPDESLLFIANANINAVAVFDVHQPGRSRSMGFIPVGWYPTSVRVTPDGKRLLVANGKGAGSRANRNGPQPGRDVPAPLSEYIGSLFKGTLEIIDLPDRESFEKQLKDYTARTYRCRPPSAPSQLEAGHPIPVKPGTGSPIKYCIYIIKENRTYDQILGDLPGGNGDPSLCLFPEKVTPNHHQLARDFVLLDNFYVESEVSADGHEWTMAAYATDYVEKIWPLSYGHNQGRKYVYPSEGRFKIAEPVNGYLWDSAKKAGVTYRSYGEFVNNGKTTNDPATSLLSALKGHFDPGFRSFDMDYPDQSRADRFLSELKRFEREGDMPRLQILRLPNDHTSGTSVGKLTPTAFVADNDLALGRVIEGISHSKFWNETAVFVVEDDAQNGADHVDAHRTIAYVISPHVKRGSVDSTLYSTSSMLRTMELILGLQPMSQFDAAAMPMFASFGTTPNAKPYVARPARISLTETNKPNAWGQKLSAKMDFKKEDAADDLLLNEIVWRSVRGANSPAPAPVHAAFVRRAAKDDDDD